MVTGLLLQLQIKLIVTQEYRTQQRADRKNGIGMALWRILLPLPDGLDALAVGTLLQADIEKAMAVWFTAQTGDAPVISQIRPKASAIIKAIAEVEKSRGHF